VSLPNLGERVYLRPGTKAYIEGDRYGVVTDVTDTLVIVKLNESGRTWTWKHQEVRNVGGS
jgi:hypothetical protein